MPCLAPALTLRARLISDDEGLLQLYGCIVCCCRGRVKHERYGNEALATRAYDAEGLPMDVEQAGACSLLLIFEPCEPVTVITRRAGA